MENVSFEDDTGEKRPNIVGAANPGDFDRNVILDALRVMGQGASFGLAPKLAGLIGSLGDEGYETAEREYLDKLDVARQNLGPGMSTGLEAMGSIITAIPTGGSGLLARGGAAVAGRLGGGLLARGATAAGTGALLGAAGGATQAFGETPISEVTPETLAGGAKAGAIGGAIGGGLGFAAERSLANIAGFEARAATGGKGAEIKRAVNTDVRPFAGEAKLDRNVQLASDKGILGGFMQGAKTTYAKADEWRKEAGKKLEEIYDAADSALQPTGGVKYWLRPKYAENLLAKVKHEAERTGTSIDAAAFNEIKDEIILKVAQTNDRMSLKELWKWRQSVDDDIWTPKGDKMINRKFDKYKGSLRNAIDKEIEETFNGLVKSGKMSAETFEDLIRLNKEYSAASIVQRMAQSGLQQEQGLMRTLGYPTVRGAIGGVIGGTAGMGLGAAADYFTSQNPDISTNLRQSMATLGLLGAPYLMARGRSANTMMWMNRKIGPSMTPAMMGVGRTYGMAASGEHQSWRYKPRTPLNDND